MNENTWLETANSSAYNAALFFLCCIYAVMLIWALIAFISKRSRLQGSYSIKRPNLFLYLLIFSVPAAGFFSIHSFIEEWFRVLFIGVIASGYLGLQLLVMEMRMRYNYFILKSDADPYEKLADLKKSNQLSVMLLLIFPLFYLPHMIWLAGRTANLRYEPRRCRKCSNVMDKSSILKKEEENQYLSKGQIKEEHLNSREWDVWRCGNCADVAVVGYSANSKKYNKCSGCGFITETMIERNDVAPATYSCDGYGFERFKCENCGQERGERYTTYHNRSLLDKKTGRF